MKALLAACLLFSCGVETSPTIDTPDVGEVIRNQPPTCPCDQAGLQAHVIGSNDLEICAPVCTATGRVPIGNTEFCDAVDPRFTECVTDGCCHWLTPKELGL